MRAAIMVAIVVSACSSDPPRWEWPEGTPEEQGMDSATLEGAQTYAFADGKYTQGVVVTRRGMLVAEWYADGRDATSYGASWSMAKSFTSALIGIAIHEGAIANEDVGLADYYPEWAADPRTMITLEHVLHMASGLAWNEDYNINNANDSDVVKLVFTTESPLAYVIGKAAEIPPNTEFEYSSGNTLLMSGILAQSTGMSAGAYAQSRLLSRLGIEGADWWRAKTGETLTYCCLDMTSRDFARFGLLYLQRGAWEGEQIIPEAWVEASITPSPRYAGYGYQWWLEGRTDPTLPTDLYAAEGHDGQFIYVIPSLELVIVRNGLYDKFDGPAIADPQLFLRYPSDGLGNGGGGTIGPDSWDHAAFLRPILDSIRG